MKPVHHYQHEIRYQQYALSAVAQIRPLDHADREEAHSQSRRDSDVIVGPYLAAGQVVDRLLQAGPEMPGEVSEIYGFHVPEATISVGPSPYFRFDPLSGGPAMLRGEALMISLYRHVKFVRAGQGIAAMRQAAGIANGQTNSFLPFAGRMMREETRRLYRVPMLTPLAHTLFESSAPDRWRLTRQALLDVGQTESAILRLRVLPMPIEDTTQAYLERIARLLGETPGLDELVSQEAGQLINVIAASRYAFLIEISASHPRVALAFCADVQADAFVETLPDLRELDADDEELKTLITRLAAVYSLSEATALLTPSITFRDALPGVVTHFTPRRLAAVAAGSPVRSAHYDPGGDFRLGVRENNGNVMLNVENLRTGMVIAAPPGTGKTTAAISIVCNVSRLRGSDAAIQIFDPVGWEWDAIASKLGVRIFRFGPNAETSLQFNPFLAAPNISLADHAMSLAALLVAICPGNKVAKDYLFAMIRASYQRVFLDRKKQPLDLLQTTGRYQADHPDLWPDFNFFLTYGPQWLQAVLDEQPSTHLSEAVQYFKLRSELMRGTILASVFSGQQALYSQLNGSFLMALGDIASRDVKSGILAVTLGLHLNAIRTSTAQEVSRLKKLIVLEEAHDIIGRQENVSGSKEMANSASEEVGLAVKDILTTGRKFGAGILILDQSLSSLDEAVVKNCSNLIALRTLYGPDQDMAGRVLGLSLAECGDLNYLATGEAILRLESSPRAHHVRLDRV